VDEILTLPACFSLKTVATRYNTVRGTLRKVIAVGHQFNPLALRKGTLAAGRLSSWGYANVFRSIGLAVALVFAAEQNLLAQEWAEKMFKELDHDFGTVARGADTVYKFEITNLYKEDMHITGVRSSCGCTSPTVENPVIKTHDKGYIVARFNTRTHVGQKGATLTVTFGAPYAAEVQLHVHGNIRSDVVFNPGSIEFGEVNLGEGGEKTVAVNYAGRTTWEIVDVTNDNENFEVELRETQRSAGKVSYNLLVRLKQDLPVGFIKDQLTVVTNDTREQSRKIPLFVSAQVRPEFTVQPPQLVIGDIPSGATVTRKLVVRGKEPFKITDVTCGEDDCFDFKTDAESRAVHFVDVTFRAGEAPAKLQTSIQIHTDRGENRGASLVASANVTPPAAAVAEPPAPAPAGETATQAQTEVRTASAP
jgi:hypothetical protein